MAAAKLLSPGLSRALAAASKSEEASKLICMPWSSGAASGRSRSRSTRSVACHLSDSFSKISKPRGTGGVDCRVPAADAFVQPHKAAKFVDTPLQASFYEVKQPEGVQAATQEFVVEEAEVGKVECNGRGCRPVLDHGDVSTALPLTDGRTQEDAAADVLQSRILHYQNRSVTRDRVRRGPKPHFPLDFAEYLDEVWMESAAAEKYFSAALAADGRDPRVLCEYAQFCWRSFSDEDKAERLFAQALELAPQDPDILAGYAHFLWQTDQ